MVLELAAVGVLDSAISPPTFAPVDAVPVLFAPTRPGRRGRARRPTPGLLSVAGDLVRILAPPTSRPCLHWADAVSVEVGYSEATRASGFEHARLSGRVVRLEADVNGVVLWARADGNDTRWNDILQWVRGLAA